MTNFTQVLSIFREMGNAAVIEIYHLTPVCPHNLPVPGILVLVGRAGLGPICLLLMSGERSQVMALRLKINQFPCLRKQNTHVSTPFLS